MDLEDHDLSTMQLLPEDASEWQIEVPYLFMGIPIVIEYLGGDTRTKVTPTGMTVTSVMPVAYGRILKTNDIHGEEIDFYLSENPDPFSHVFVIDQINPVNGVFDEHKVMFGFDSQEEAVATYLSVFSDMSGDKRIGAVSSLSIDDFVTWVTTEGECLKPIHDTTLDLGIEKCPMCGFGRAINPAQLKTPERDAAGGVVVSLPDLSQGPIFSVKASGPGVYSYHLYLSSPLITQNWSNVVDRFCRALDMASDEDTVHIEISGHGGSVFLMGRMISAMERTKAKVYTYAKGAVASAAVTVWAYGHERHILPGAFFMQHMSSQILAGKTPDIVAKSTFCINYIRKMLIELVHIGLFTQDEVDNMIDGSEDIYISGREAVSRIGRVTTRERM